VIRALALLLLLWSTAAPALTVGSKRFAESHVLAEIAAQLLEGEGFAVERAHGLGGSLIAWQALGAGGPRVYSRAALRLRQGDSDAEALLLELMGEAVVDGAIVGEKQP
jgi:hypothetical protein